MLVCTNQFFGSCLGQSCSLFDLIFYWLVFLVSTNVGFCEATFSSLVVPQCWLVLHLHHLHLSLNCMGRCGITDEFTTSFLHFSLFSTALWDLANPRPVHSLMLSSYLFYCLVFFQLSLCLER